ncbi:MAG TPA: energy-coupling factor transporter transmembrane component T [Solirubrobacteraceae bacterium]|nr:energy-coupling factor transporter transmembrane component T [Solirubrobacteraceae bacterium]
MYRRHASVLHTARAGVAGAYGSALVLLALCFTHPIVLGAVAFTAVAAAALSGVGRDVARAARFAVPVALLVALVNALVVRDGLTVVARLGELPPFGELDVTLEALVYGLLLGLRVLTIVVCAALLTATVDPDALLRGLRRASLRSALTASLATRMVPVLARDTRRMQQARRCRPDGGARTRRAQLAVVRAVTTGALDRAVDVAATLELRGYALGRRPPRAGGRRWSRHDLSLAAAAAALLALVVWGLGSGAARVQPYPRLVLQTGRAELALAALVPAIALAPLLSRRGVGGP